MRVSGPHPVITPKIGVSAAPLQRERGCRVFTIGNFEGVRSLWKFGTVEIDKDQTIISVVGNEISQTANIKKKLFESIQNIPVRMVSYGGSPHNISLLVPAAFKTQIL